MKSVCPTRSAHEGRDMPHLYTSRARWREKHGRWAPWRSVCSWCAKGMPTDSIMVEYTNG